MGKCNVFSILLCTLSVSVMQCTHKSSMLQLQLNYGTGVVGVIDRQSFMERSLNNEVTVLQLFLVEQDLHQ